MAVFPPASAWWRAHRHEHRGRRRARVEARVLLSAARRGAADAGLHVAAQGERAHGAGRARSGEDRLREEARSRVDLEARRDGEVLSRDLRCPPVVDRWSRRTPAGIAAVLAVERVEDRRWVTTSSGRRALNCVLRRVRDAVAAASRWPVRWVQRHTIGSPHPAVRRRSARHEEGAHRRFSSPRVPAEHHDLRDRPRRRRGRAGSGRSSCSTAADLVERYWW